MRPCGNRSHAAFRYRCQTRRSHNTLSSRQAQANCPTQEAHEWQVRKGPDRIGSGICQQTEYGSPMPSKLGLGQKSYIAVLENLCLMFGL